MGLDSAPADQSSPRAQAEEEGAKQHESEQPAPQKPKYKPTSFLEQAAELARQEELALARGEAPPDHAGPPVGSQTLVMPADPDSARAHSEDSIEQYMAKLLNRVRTSAEARESGNSESEDKPADAAANTADESPADESKEPEPPQPIVRRPSVPEAPEKLSQMRELANSAARSAIHAHAKQNANRVVKRKSRVAILSGIGAVGLGVVFCVTGSVPAIAGSLSFSVICFFMIVRAIQHSMRHMRLHPPGKPLVDEEAEEAKPVADSPPEQVSEAATEASESVVCVEGSSTSADTP